MTEAYKMASENSRKQQGQVDTRRNAKHTLGALYPQDKVLIKNVRETGGPGKLRSHWEKYLYEVIAKKGGEDSVVYDVRRIGHPDAEIRTVHRNMLLLCNELPIEVNDCQDKNMQDVPKPADPVNKSTKDDTNIPRQVLNEFQDNDAEEIYDQIELQPSKLDILKINLGKRSVHPKFH